MGSLKLMNWGKYKLFSLVNQQGTQVDISDLGGLIVNFYVQDQNNQTRNIVLGYDTPDEYLNGACYLGCVVGPWANRIANGRYSIDDINFALEQNENTNHLHGASANLGAKCWTVEIIDETTLKLVTTINANEASYPYTIDFEVTYHLSEENELRICYEAMPHGKTPINMTQHTYFNLDESENVLNHSIQINSDRYLTVDSCAIPLFEAPVEDTPFDLRQSIQIKQGMDLNNQQLKAAGGYDHCWCFEPTEFQTNAIVSEETSGLYLHVASDQIGMQFYTGNFLNQEQGRNSRTYHKHAGLCLETQCYPNQINMDNKEDCIYGPNKPYRHNVVYQVLTTK
ncbi:aldose 1-epimerase [Vibrio crassostreae]|uniref:aldose epimerase family protein n=1 Tax=Vibrio crassostreae TaxID=246167 RepID=UPI000F4736FC|nr:aldose epimerase family protein [Vibrio crassostreae]ROR21119.1 aldose 1-epimerase [Vibrio crassostreae]